MHISILSMWRLIQAQSRWFVNNFWSLLHRWLQKRVGGLEQWPQALQITPGKGELTQITSRMEKECEGSWVDTKHSPLPHLHVLQQEKPPVPLSSHRWQWSHQSPAGEGCTAGLHLSCSQDGQGRLSIISDSISGLKCLFSCHQLGPKLV